MTNPAASSASAELKAINNPDLLLEQGRFFPVRVGLSWGGCSVSSRPKRVAGWESQDRAALSVLPQVISAESLRRAYQGADDATRDEEGGCSATTLVLTEDSVQVAWLGDSPAFLVGADKTTGKIVEIIGLNEPHIPTYERADILARGGLVNDDGRIDLPSADSDQANCYSLSMSRAFGNRWLGNLLNREPGLIHHPLSTLSPSLSWSVLVASDGILPESERNLMHPRNMQASFADRDLITYCAGLVQELLNSKGQAWLASVENRAACLTQIAQERLAEMEAQADKSEVGYAAIDDTTAIVLSLDSLLPYLASQHGSVVVTVADGHRLNGEVAAQKAVEAIHRRF